MQTPALPSPVAAELAVVVAYLRGGYGALSRTQKSVFGIDPWVVSEDTDAEFRRRAANWLEAFTPQFGGLVERFEQQGMGEVRAETFRPPYSTDLVPVPASAPTDASKDACLALMRSNTATASSGVASPSNTD
jgi:hypothetical protein